MYPYQVYYKNSKDIQNYYDNYFKDNILFKNKIVRIGYITNEGTVNLNQNVLIHGDTVSKEELNILMRDPRTNKNEESGEYNNSLNHKYIYGLSIAIFDAEIVDSNDKSKNKPKAKPRSKFNFNF